MTTQLQFPAAQTERERERASGPPPQAKTLNGGDGQVAKKERRINASECGQRTLEEEEEDEDEEEEEVCRPHTGSYTRRWGRPQQQSY